MTSTAQRLQVIIVEDNRLLLEALADHLRTQMFAVHAMNDSSGLDALLQSQQTHLLILDLNLPSEDGFSIALRVRKKYPWLGILILSARKPAQPGEAWEQAVDLFLAKPVTPDALSDAVHRLCALTNSRRV